MKNTTSGSFLLNGESVTMESMFAEMEAENAKKNLRNFINNKIFPKGIGDYAACYALTHPWLIFAYYKHELKYAWQRVVRGWDDKAVWSIDSYLSKLIPALVTELKDRYIGLPIDMFDGLTPDEKYSYSEEQEAIAHARWDIILNKIINGFKAYSKLDYHLDCTEEEISKLQEEYEEGFKTLKEYFSNLWW